MQNIAYKFVEILGGANDFLFGPIDSAIAQIQMADWAKDALTDSVHMLPFLFVIFLVIEFMEYFFAHKMTSIIKNSNKTGPFIGSLLASLPQCGFSVVASTLYSKKLIAAGTLIAVFLSTSDEAIPVILAEPGNAHIVVKLLAVKILIAVLAGYLINFIIEKTQKNPVGVLCQEEANEDEDEDEEEEMSEEGCHRHHLHKNPDKKELLIHPLMHTASVFIFVFIVTLAINYLVMLAGGEENLGKYFLGNTIFQPVITACFGLIPNCAASVAITMMYLKGAIGFGSVISGLCSSAGLGMLVLLRKNNDIKDSLRIIGLLLLISIISGITIQFFYN